MRKNSEHKTIRTNLVEMLTRFPALAENYNALVVSYWANYDNDKPVRESTSVESITRNFRLLVEAGVINLPERIKVARKAKEVAYRNEFSAFA